MRYITHADYIEVNEKLWRINSRKSGCYSHMLKKMVEQLDVMLAHHSKVLMIRFDLRCRELLETNSVISDFNLQLFRKLKSEYQFTKIAFSWAREMEKAKQQHYHYALLLDGNKVQHPARILKAVEEIWSELAGEYWIPEKCYLNIRRGNHDEQEEAVYRISYLAKGRGKGYRQSQTKDYGTSRIKPPVKASSARNDNKTNQPPTPPTGLAKNCANKALRNQFTSS